MASWKLLEVHTEDQTPHKWCVSLSEETFKRMFSHGSPTVHKIFGDGSLFSPMLFGKFFDPSDAFPLWDFESDVLLSNLRSSGKTSIDWFQTDDAYVLKADLPGVGSNIVQIYVENGKVMEISGQWKLQGRSVENKTTGEVAGGGNLVMSEGLSYQKMSIGGKLKHL
ncbi:hypothetical protein OIU84_024253 [Salix udensis]|uniref:Uncharacterized protein n=1 Tax=Salix udensis TaxID=889485 RepID=A0AAD6KGY7_9ROSI|nr:hypothetical protein OIU84_024253 [Salix udensis]